MGIPMTQLRTGGTGTVLELTAQGVMRERLVDLGVIPGAMIRRLMNSPAGDPICFLIRGAQVALRSADAALVRVSA